MKGRTSKQIIVQANAKTNTSSLEGFMSSLEQPQTLSDAPWKFSTKRIPPQIREALGLGSGRGEGIPRVARRDAQEEVAGLQEGGAREGRRKAARASAGAGPDSARGAQDPERRKRKRSASLQSEEAPPGEAREPDTDADDLVITSDKPAHATKDPLTHMDLAVESERHFPLALPCGHVYNYSTLHVARPLPPSPADPTASTCSFSAVRPNNATGDGCSRAVSSGPVPSRFWRIARA